MPPSPRIPQSGVRVNFSERPSPNSESPMEVYETLPIVPLRDVVVFPHMMMPFVIGRPSSTRALEHALAKDKKIFLAAQHDDATDDPRPDDIFTMGCVANVVQS